MCWGDVLSFAPVPPSLTIILCEMVGNCVRVQLEFEVYDEVFIYYGHLYKSTKAPPTL